MLEHLSKTRFIKYVADFTKEQEWTYKGIYPAVIIFHESINLYENNLQDIYVSLKVKFPNVKFYQVLIDKNPEIAHAYGIEISPSTMFVPLINKPIIIEGFLSSEQVEKEVLLLIKGKLNNKKSIL